MLDGRGVHAAPRVPRALVQRPRLYAGLDAGAALTVVRGPAGSGKTVLLADWCRRQPRHGVWITVDEGRASERGFWSYVLDLLADAALVTPGGILGQSIAAETTSDVTSLLHRGLAQLDRPIVIVVDDAHRLDDETVRGLCRLLTLTPQVSIVIGTRTRQSFESGEVALDIDVEIVSDLEFTIEEAEAYLSAAGSSLAPHEVVAATGGLPLAIRAVSLARPGAPGDLPDHQKVAASLTAWLLPAVRTAVDDPDFYATMLRCSVAEELTVDLAEELSGSQRAGGWLDLAEDRGLGMWGSTPPYFRLTTAVRSVLRQELERADPVTARRLVRIVAEWCLRHRRESTAVELAVAELDDLELAARAVRQGGLSMMHTYGPRYVRLMEPISRLRLSRHPVLAMTLGLCYNARRASRAKAIELLGLAAVSSRALPGTSAGDRALLRGLESAALRVISLQDTGRAAARASARHLAELSLAETESLGELVPLLHVHNGISLYYAGDDDEAIAQFERSFAAGHRTHEGLHAIAMLAGAHALAGDLDAARHWLQIAAERPWPDGWWEGYRGAFVHVALAVLALEELDFGAAESALDTIWPLIDTIEHWAVLVHLRAMADLGAGRTRMALERVQTLRSQKSRRAATTGQSGLLLDQTTAILQLALGDRIGAEHALAGRRHHAHPSSLCGRARIYLAAGDAESALAALGRAAAAGPGSARLRAEHALLSAAVLHRVGREDDALAELDRALAISGSAGLRMPMVLLPSAERAELHQLAEGRPGAAVLTRGPAIPEVIGNVHSIPRLTGRERVILAELTRTSSVTQIADRLHVSPNTVKSQLRSLYRKLGVSSRHDAIAVGMAHGLIAPSGSSQ